MKERDIKEEKIKIKKTVKSLRKMNFVVCKIICYLERKENYFYLHHKQTL